MSAIYPMDYNYTDYELIAAQNAFGMFRGMLVISDYCELTTRIEHKYVFVPNEVYEEIVH